MDVDCNRFRTPSINVREYEEQIVRTLAAHLEKGYSPQQSLDELLGKEGIKDQHQELAKKLYEGESEKISGQYRQKRSQVFKEKNKALKQFDQEIDQIKKQIEEQRYEQEQELEPIKEEEKKAEIEYQKEVEDFRKDLDEQLSRIEPHKESNLSKYLGYAASLALAPLAALAAAGGMAASYVGKKFQDYRDSKQDRLNDRSNESLEDEKQKNGLENKDYENERDRSDSLPKQDEKTPEMQESYDPQEKPKSEREEGMQDRGRKQDKKQQEPKLEDRLSNQDESDLINQLGGKSIEEMKRILEGRKRKVGFLKVAYKGVELGARGLYNSARRLVSNDGKK